jgi:hypothetical protein
LVINFNFKKRSKFIQKYSFLQRSIKFKKCQLWEEKEI